MFFTTDHEMMEFSSVLKELKHFEIEDSLFVIWLWLVCMCVFMSVCTWESCVLSGKWEDSRQHLLIRCGFLLSHAEVVAHDLNTEVEKKHHSKCQLHLKLSLLLGFNLISLDTNLLTVCSFANCGFVHTTKIMFTVTCPSQKIIFVVPLSVEFPKNMLFLFKIHFSIFCLHMMFRD